MESKGNYFAQRSQFPKSGNYTVAQDRLLKP